MPTKAKCNLFVCGSTHLETDGGGNARGMSDEAGDMQTKIVIRIRISSNACFTEDIPHVIILKANTFALGGAALTQRLVGWDAEKMSSPDNVDTSHNGIGRRAGRKATKTPDRKIGFALSKRNRIWNS